MQVPKGMTVNLSVREEGVISLDVAGSILTRTDAIALAGLVRRLGRTLPDTVPRGGRLKTAVKSRVRKRLGLKASDVNAAPTPAEAG